MKKAARIGWPVAGVVFAVITIIAAISAAKEEGITGVMLVFCSVMFACGVLGSAIKTKEAWS